MNISNLYHNFYNLFTALQLNIHTLGTIDGYPIWLATPPTPAPQRAMIVTGVHGDEPAGLLALLKHLKQRQKQPHSETRYAHLSYLPILNPTGVKNDTRTNRWNEDPNRGFFNNNLTREGRLLMEHTQLLTECSRDGILSLHEDIDMSDFYLYVIEDEPSSLKDHMRAVVTYPKLNGISENDQVTDGLIYNIFLEEGAFEDHIKVSGARRLVVTETPAKHPLKGRIIQNLKLIDAFAKVTDTVPQPLP